MKNIWFLSKPFCRNLRLVAICLFRRDCWRRASETGIFFRGRRFCV